jgi:nitrate reductase NapAB chaperone NapD
MRQLYQSKLKPDQSMQEYIRSTLELVERLCGIGEDIKDFHVAALLLSGLPDNYETLVTALDAQPDDELTLEYVKGKLIDEYKRKTEGASSAGSESALKTYDKVKPVERMSVAVVTVMLNRVKLVNVSSVRKMVT